MHDNSRPPESNQSKSGSEKISDLLGDFDHDRSKQNVKRVPKFEKQEGEDSMTPAMLRQQQEYVKAYREAKK